jgi:hypothetical protein
MKRIKDVLILALFVWIILLFTCNKSDSEPVITTSETVRVDSVYIVTHTIDTFDRIIRVPVASAPITDTVFLYGDVSTYVYEKEDSLLSYKIEVDADCYPEDVRIEYNVKQFTIKDSVSEFIYVRDSSHTKEVIRKSYLSAGAMVSGSSNSFGFAPMLSYNHKKGNSYSAGYDVINGTIMIGFTKRLFK